MDFVLEQMATRYKGLPCEGQRGCTCGFNVAFSEIFRVSLNFLYRSKPEKRSIWKHSAQLAKEKGDKGV